MSLCGCTNPWAPSGPSTKRVCGTFDEPENPDKGQCSPYREKRTCEAPVRPQNQCNDTEAYAEAVPGGNPPFIIVSTLFDENCDPILDENGARILTTS